MDAGFVLKRLEEVSLLVYRNLSRSEVSRHFLPALTTQAEAIDDLVIALNVYALEVVQKTSALRDHLEQAAPRMVIFLVRLEMLGQLVNSLAKQSNLHLW